MAELKLYEVEVAPGVTSLQQFTPETAKRLGLGAAKGEPAETYVPRAGSEEDLLGDEPKPTRRTAAKK